MSYLTLNIGQQTYKGVIDFGDKKLFDSKPVPEYIKILNDLIKVMSLDKNKNNVFDRERSIYFLYLYKNRKYEFFAPEITEIHFDRNGDNFSMSSPLDIAEIKRYYETGLLRGSNYDGHLSKEISEDKSNVEWFDFGEVYDDFEGAKIINMPKPGLVKGLFEYNNYPFTFYVAKKYYRSPVFYSIEEDVDSNEYEFVFYNYSAESWACNIGFKL